MNKRHKHYDVIVAWAEGKEIQFYREGEWTDFTGVFSPDFTDNQVWRIKPENPYDRIINKAINEVDFESIHKIIIALDWCYYNYRYIPSIEQLKEQLREMCNDLFVKKLTLKSSGIFSVSKYNGSLRIQVTAVADTFVYLGGMK